MSLPSPRDAPMVKREMQKAGGLREWGLERGTI